MDGDFEFDFIPSARKEEEIAQWMMPNSKPYWISGQLASKLATVLTTYSTRASVQETDIDPSINQSINLVVVLVSHHQYRTLLHTAPSLISTQNE